MAYMRGDTYIWKDDEYLHLWVAEGNDGWNDSVWACDEDGSRRTEMENASGVGIPIDVMDEYVVMRIVQLIYEGKIRETVARVIEHNSNTGAQMLRKNADSITQTLSELELSCAEPYCWKDE